MHDKNFKIKPYETTEYLLSNLSGKISIPLMASYCSLVLFSHIYFLFLDYQAACLKADFASFG